MSVSGHRQTKGSSAFSEILPGQKESTSPEVARRILVHTVERTEIITQKLQVQVESHKTQHILGGADAFEKNDILNTTSRYLEGLGSAPSPDSRRVFLIGKNLQWFSDEPSPSLERALREAEKGVANGVATLDANALVVQDPANAQVTPAPNKIPKANANGKLELGWIPAGVPNGVATLDANSLVVQDPANAQVTPAPNKIPKANANGKLELGWIPSGVDAGKLQGRNVSSAAPQDGQALVWNAATSQWEPKTLGGNVSGSGSAGQVAFWTGTTSLGGSANFVWDNTNNRVGVRNSSPSSSLHIGGSIAGNVTTVGANTTLDETHFTVLVNASSAPITITLPGAPSCPGRIYTIKKIDSTSNSVTVRVPEGSPQAIEGNVAITLSTQYASLTVQSTGLVGANAWIIIASRG